MNHMHGSVQAYVMQISFGVVKIWPHWPSPLFTKNLITRIYKLFSYASGKGYTFSNNSMSMRHI